MSPRAAWRLERLGYSPVYDYAAGKSPVGGAGAERTAPPGRGSYQSIEGTGRFDSIDQWVTTEVRGWTLSGSVSDERLAGLIEAARDRLGRFETAGGCVFGMTAKVATWKHE